MKKIYLFITLLLCIIIPGYSSSTDENDTTNTVTWQGGWENSTEHWGTFEATLTFTGSNMSYNGGSGSVAGFIIWTRWDGTILISSAVAGSWRNTLSSGHDALEFEFISIENDLSVSGFIQYETAAEINDSTFEIGGFALSTDTGSWFTDKTTDNIEIPAITHAVTINHSGAVSDLAYIGGTLYATIFDDPDYTVITINPSDGSTLEITTDCVKPGGITFDGTYTWITGEDVSGNAGLYRYTGTNISTADSGYPVNNTLLAGEMALSYGNGSLYFHNGSILFSTVGTINTTSGTPTPLLADSFGSVPDLSRTKKLQVLSDGFYTSYFAPGDVWCEIRKLNYTGSLVSALYCPLNTAAPVAVEGSTLYLIQGNPGRLFIISL